MISAFSLGNSEALHKVRFRSSFSEKWQTNSANNKGLRTASSASLVTL